MACVNLPEFPLQILLKSHPDWEHQPVAVVDQDKPLGVILWINDYARDAQILTGMRYAAGLALARDLRAAVVSEDDIEAATETIARQLLTFSPRIEPSPTEPGIFWMDASGLQRLYRSLTLWATTLSDDLRDNGFSANVSVGFTRFGSYATARALSENRVFDSIDEERLCLDAVPVQHLGVTPRLRDSLAKLGIHDLGHFITLPPDGIRRRFGREAHDLHALSRNTHTTPLKPFILDEPARRVHPFDVAETNRARLVTQLSPMLTALLHDLSDRRQALEHVRLSLTLDDRRYLLESLTPASPTLNSVHLLDLLRLRIDSLVLSAGVVEMMIEGHGINAAAHQLEMFHDAHTRDRSAVNDSFAAIRAEFGNDAILYARIQDAHLPESRVDWAPLHHLPPARPRITTDAPLVRRLYDTPVALSLHTDKPPSGMLIARAADGPIEEVVGPHTVRSHWWHVPVTRAYYYVRTQSGRWLWIFHDTTQHKWYMHGEVE